MLPKFPADATFETFPSPTEGERSHYARELWPPGPWTDEPHDKVSWVDPATGLDCLMVRGGMGAWCGYVGISRGHPWFEVEYGGCINRHPPRTWEEKLAKARKWVAEARAAAELDPTGLSASSLKLAELALQPLEEEGDNWWKHHNEWPCTAYDHDPRCSTPEGELNAHGGITYSGMDDDGRISVGKKGERWFFGFDTNHSMDVAPGMLASSKQMKDIMEAKGEDKDLFTDHLDYSPITGTLEKYGDTSVYRNMAYVKGEVEGLAQQLAAQQPKQLIEGWVEGEVVNPPGMCRLVNGRILCD